MEVNNLADKLLSTGLTFDDVLIAPRYSTVVPSEVDVATRLTARIGMHVPILSSPMDTVTEAILLLKAERDESLEGIRQGLADAAAARMQPVEELFAELRREFKIVGTCRAF